MTKHQAYEAIRQELPQDKDIQARLERARSQVLSYGYEIRTQGKGYIVEKLSTSLLEDNSQRYHVTSKECTCPDYETVRAGLCKHRLAIMIIERMKK